jgi:hypothetical protein
LNTIPPPPPSPPARARRRPRSFFDEILVAVARPGTGLLLFVLGAGLVSLGLGQDASWDLKSYHYYNPWAFLNKRAAIDLAPAGIQSFHNPAADLPFYALVASGLPACRFFGTPGVGPNSHFFTIDVFECTKVRANPAWTFESLAFQADPPGVGTCAGDRAVVTRLYNNGKGGQANHRYATSHEVAGNMVGEGWLIEGPVFCTPP